jgi:hypothetical protein
MALFPSTFYKKPTKINILIRFNIIIVKSMEKRLSPRRHQVLVTYGQPLSEGRRSFFTMPTGHLGSPLNINQ